MLGVQRNNCVICINATAVTVMAVALINKKLMKFYDRKREIEMLQEIEEFGRDYDTFSLVILEKYFRVSLAESKQYADYTFEYRGFSLKDM